MKSQILSFILTISITSLLAQQLPCGKTSCGGATNATLLIKIQDDNGNSEAEILNDSMIFLGDDMIFSINPQNNVMNLGNKQAIQLGNPNLWDGGVIPYVIKKNHPWEKFIKQVIDYFNSISSYTNICFKEKEKGDHDYIYFIEGNESIVKNPQLRNRKTCWSHVGKQGGEQFLAITGVNYPPMYLQRAVLHEICHAIGLIHEHQLPWRDKFIKLNSNICKDCETRNFAKQTPMYYAAYKDQYDYLSIMHYAPCLCSSDGNYSFKCIDNSGNIIKCPEGIGEGDGKVNTLTQKDIQKIRALYPYKSRCVRLPSLFLFDLSGSMNEQGASGSPKIEEAKIAAKATLQNIAQGVNKGVAQEVAIRGFSGDCLADPTYPITNDFTTDLASIEQAINSIPYPNGGTPLAEAIDACKQRLQEHLNNTGAKQAKLIILSDGQATCTPIRPNGVFATGQVTITVPAQQNASPIKYYTVGFNIAPGSPAERDLQYLAQISGGKYLNAQNQFELMRAFQKFNRIYIPKPVPSLTNLPNTATDIFSKGLILIENETYSDALERYREFVTQQPTDCNGAFNLALMCEANDLYKSAAKYYETYLTLCPNTTDKEEVMRQIENVKKDYEIYIQYNRNVIMSDMAYLDYHFKKIQNGESVALATEFIGFIKEKWFYYKNLSEILEIDTRPFKSSAQDVFRGLQDCVETIKRNPQTWDRDATPVLSRTYINMERLLQTF